MKTKLFLILTLLMLTIGLAIPTTGAAAATRTFISGKEAGFVNVDPSGGTFCPPDSIVVHSLPNDKTNVHDMMASIEFLTSDPRFTGVNVVCFNFHPGATDKVTPVTGIFRFYPYGIDGYWDGRVSGTIYPDGVHSVFTAKGYGALARLMLQGTNNDGVINGEIITLPDK